MDKILINDLLRLSAHDISNTRLKLNVFNGNTDPLEEYKKIPIKLTRNGFYGTTKGDTFIQGRSPSEISQYKTRYGENLYVNHG